MTSPKLLIDFSPAGLKKGIYKFFGPVSVGVIIASLSQYIPVLQAKVTNGHDIRIVIGSSIAIGLVKLIVTWLTTTNATVDVPPITVPVQTTQYEIPSALAV